MDEELEKIRKRKLKELQELMNKSPLPNTPIDLTDQDLDQAISKYPKLVIDC